MDYRTFPATGDDLSVVGFGAMGMAGWFGDNDAIRALHTALDLGVNVVDTARAYGRSEHVVGKALASWPGTQPFLMTKIQPQVPRSQFAAPPPVEDVFPKGWVTRNSSAATSETRGDDACGGEGAPGAGSGGLNRVSAVARSLLYYWLTPFRTRAESALPNVALGVRSQLRSHS